MPLASYTNTYIISAIDAYNVYLDNFQSSVFSILDIQSSVQSRVVLDHTMFRSPLV